MEGIKRFPNIFKPGQIGTLRIKNRIVMAPMGTAQSHDGKITRQQIAYFAERAKGEVGLIETECTLVNTRLCGSTGTLRMSNDSYILGHSDLVELVHAYGSKICMQLYHPGRHFIPDPNSSQTPVAPSPPVEPVTGQAYNFNVPAPRELTLEEIYELIESFGSAARRARLAGYDAIEVHGAHGYLVHQFMSPHTNRRTDLFGGNAENRMRFPTEVIKSIKQEAGTDFPVIFRMTAEETMVPNGYLLEDAKFFAKCLELAGIDALHVSMGASEETDRVNRSICPMSYNQGWRLPYVEALKKVVNVPVIGVGVFREPEFVESVLLQGKADFIALGRQLLADPYWVKKTAQYKVKLIRKCISCNYCFSAPGIVPPHCSINPEKGRELDFSEIQPAPVSKKVMIIGSGPGGMEAARVAANRGHNVSIYEKGSRLGAGQLNLAMTPPHKEKIKWLRDFLVAEIEELKVEVHLDTEVNAEMVCLIKPDIAIVATGARPLIPNIPGVENKNVVTAHDILAGIAIVEGRKVAVLGQFSTGAETAEFLAQQENQVIIVARSSIQELACGSYASNRFDLIARLDKNEKVTILNDCITREIKENGITIADREGKERFIEIDKVVLAHGVIPINELGEQLKGKIAEVYIIGDAAKPRDMASAIYEGYVIARSI